MGVALHRDPEVSGLRREAGVGPGGPAFADPDPDVDVRARLEPGEASFDGELDHPDVAGDDFHRGDVGLPPFQSVAHAAFLSAGDQGEGGDAAHQSAIAFDDVFEVLAGQPPVLASQCLGPTAFAQLDGVDDGAVLRLSDDQ